MDFYFTTSASTFPCYQINWTKNEIYTKTDKHLIVRVQLVQFSINFQVFTNNNQHNFIKFYFKFIVV